MRVLGADIGGTKTLIAVAEVVDGRLRLIDERRYDSGAYVEFADLLEDFIAALDRRPERACLAVAGPISADGHSVQATNVPWRMDAKALEARFGASFRLINDFQAQAQGVALLTPQDLRVLQPGIASVGAQRAIIGAGTGLGFAQLFPTGEDYATLPSEAGHTDFAPSGALQRELLAWLEERLGGHVSVERVLSGPGLSSIYRFLADREPGRIDEALGREMVAEDFGAAVSYFALERGDGLAREALDLFITAYGAYAGSLALVTLPYGGLFISGGIAGRIVDALVEDERFISAFNDKGRMAHITRAIPVNVVTNPRVGLLGALRAAQTLS